MLSLNNNIESKTMKTTTILLFILILGTQVFSQTFDEKKAWVREKYSDVENNPTNYGKTYVVQPDPDYPPHRYYHFLLNSEDELIKAYSGFGEEGYSDEETYYFDDGKLFFGVLCSSPLPSGVHPVIDPGRIFSSPPVCPPVLC